MSITPLRHDHLVRDEADGSIVAEERVGEVPRFWGGDEVLAYDGVALEGAGFVVGGGAEGFLEYAAEGAGVEGAGEGDLAGGESGIGGGVGGGVDAELEGGGDVVAGVVEDGCVDCGCVCA